MNRLWVPEHGKPGEARGGRHKPQAGQPRSELTSACDDCTGGLASLAWVSLDSWENESASGWLCAHSVGCGLRRGPPHHHTVPCPFDPVPLPFSPKTYYVPASPRDTRVSGGRGAPSSVAGGHCPPREELPHPQEPPGPPSPPGSPTPDALDWALCRGGALPPTDLTPSGSRDAPGGAPPCAASPAPSFPLLRTPPWTGPHLPPEYSNPPSTGPMSVEF